MEQNYIKVSSQFLGVRFGTRVPNLQWAHFRSLLRVEDDNAHWLKTQLIILHKACGAIKTTNVEKKLYLCKKKLAEYELSADI
jgi:hypothetical protein